MNAPLNQFATYRETEDSADFLAELSRVCDDVVMIEGKKSIGTMEFDRVNSKSQKANKNISSIVSRIRDEGSAFDTVEGESNNRTESRRTVNTNNVMKFDSRDTRSVDKTEININTAMESKLDMDEVTQEQQGKTTESGPETTKLDTGMHKQADFKLNLFLLFSYLLVAILLSGVVIMFYQIKVQSDDLKNTLILYKKVIRKNELNKKDIHSKNKIFIAPERLKNYLTKKTQTITRQNGEIVPVKISAKGKDNSLQKVVTPVIRQSKTPKQNIRVVAADIKSQSSLKNPSNKNREKVKSESTNKKTVVKNKTQYRKNRPVNLKLVSGSTSTRIPAPVIFAVNLASFSDQKKATQQLKRLQSDGVEAVIEAATVRGKKVFRLGVNGFSTRDEARVFILQVNKKYGFEGWVRRSYY